MALTCAEKWHVEYTLRTYTRYTFQITHAHHIPGMLYTGCAYVSTTKSLEAAKHKNINYCLTWPVKVPGLMSINDDMIRICCGSKCIIFNF
jgi:predicted GTPase